MDQTSHSGDQTSHSGDQISHSAVTARYTDDIDRPRESTSIRDNPLGVHFTKPFYRASDGEPRDMPPRWLALGLAGSIGAIYAFYLFGISAISGDTPFWRLPTGLNGGAIDIRNTLSGYWWFVEDRWRWPMLAVTTPNWPEGTNAERFDIVPVVAVLGKIWATTAGQYINPYPLWVTACFVLNAMALAALVRMLGQRGLLAAITAGAMGAMAPVVVSRFGHLGLIAHWLPLFGLALYFDRPVRRSTIAASLGLCFMATGVHLYLYVMTAAIGAATILRGLLERERGFAWSAAALASILLVGVSVLWITGILAEPDLTGMTGDYRRYSMNLLSPFWPQTSGVLSWTGVYWLTRGMIGGTAGQYEGFSYLGLGGLTFVLAAGAVAWRDIVRCWRRHIAIGLVFLALTLWSLSDRIYLGPWMILSYETPSILATTVFSWFRSSGRFFWPVAWFVLAFGIAGVVGDTRIWRARVVIAFALLLQWVDVMPWRAKIFDLVEHPDISVFGDRDAADTVANLMRTVGAVSVSPSFGCSSETFDYSGAANAAAMEIQLMAAHANARMTRVLLSRGTLRCDDPEQLPRPYLSIALPALGAIAVRPADATCSHYGKAEVCQIGAP